MEEYLSSNLDAVVVTIPTLSHRGHHTEVTGSYAGQVS